MVEPPRPGNYGFFNLLTVVTSLILLDDAAWPAWLRRRLDAKPEAESSPLRLRVFASLRRLARWPRNAAATVILIVSATTLCMPFMKRPAEDLPDSLIDLRAWLDPFDSVSSYGLFRTMTTKRPEIIVEGSRDGVDWRAYEFPNKPGDPSARPRFTVFHMPRLDWELWFSALAGHCTRALTYLDFVRRLLDGSPSVRGLLANDPFPDAPPPFIRSTLWAYEFTTSEERAQTGAYWKRRRLGLYCPTVALQDGDLVPVEP